MFRRYWLPLVAIVVLLGSVQAQPVGQHAGGYNAAQQGKPKPQANATPAVPITVQNDIHSIAGALKAENDKPPSSTDERNAKAQEQVAWWTPGLFFLGVAELLVTLGGIWLVYDTLRETRKGNTAAREIGEAQVRAYLSCEDSRCETLDDSFTVWITFKNSGQSPASKISVDCDASVMTNDFRQRYSFELFPRSAPPIGGGGTAHVAINFSARDLRDSVGKSPNAGLFQSTTLFTVRGAVTWDDVFQKQQAMAFTLTLFDLSKTKTIRGSKYRHGIMAARNRTPVTQEEWEREEAEWAKEQAAEGRPET